MKQRIKTIFAGGVLALILLGGAKAGHRKKTWPDNLERAMRPTNGDYVEAMRFLRPFAEAGNTDGQFLVGWMYEGGLGVRQAFDSAAIWYRKSAAQGNTPGQEALGWMSENGIGMPKNYTNALVWFNPRGFQRGK